MKFLFETATVVLVKKEIGHVARPEWRFLKK
jgi:hypothetical protein